MMAVPPPPPLNPWKWPTRPWARLHLDFARPFEGKLFLIVIDAHSKWIEAVCTHSTSLVVVIAELHSVFAQFGIPEMIVTDNDTGFVRHGIRHVTSAPHHPASNGLAERVVQVLKKELLLGKRPRTVLDLLKPHTAESRSQTTEAKANHDLRAKDRKFRRQDILLQPWYWKQMAARSSYQTDRSCFVSCCLRRWSP